jgi:hypothetical protein
MGSAGELHLPQVLATADEDGHAEKLHLDRIRGQLAEARHTGGPLHDVNAAKACLERQALPLRERRALVRSDRTPRVARESRVELALRAGSISAARSAIAERMLRAGKAAPPPNYTS